MTVVEQSALQANDCFEVSVPRIVHIALRDPQTHEDRAFALTVEQARALAKRLNDAADIISEKLFDKSKEKTVRIGAKVAERKR